MPIRFKLDERMVGFSASSAKEGEEVSVMFRELLGPTDPHLVGRLRHLDESLFSKIPGLPDPSRIAHLVVVVGQDLNAIAYVDELKIVYKAKAAGPVKKGSYVCQKDISEVKSVDLGIEVPPSSAVIAVFSFRWNRSLFYDFGPLLEDAGPRSYSVESALGQLMTLLFGLPAAGLHGGAGESRLQSMREAIERLGRMLQSGSKVESEYQQLLADFPWMLGASYSSAVRHQKMDDGNIPDFTALRAYDDCHDIVELKHPFLALFRADGSFSAAFNDAWNQAERYLDFCHRQRTYLLEQKYLRFENPRCILLIGNELTLAQRNAIRTKESMNRLITIITYDQLERNARHVFNLVAEMTA